jgi:hypothetical protein
VTHAGGVPAARRQELPVQLLHQELVYGHVGGRTHGGAGQRQQRQDSGDQAGSQGATSQPTACGGGLPPVPVSVSSPPPQAVRTSPPPPDAA